VFAVACELVGCAMRDGRICSKSQNARNVRQREVATTLTSQSFSGFVIFDAKMSFDLNSLQQSGTWDIVGAALGGVSHVSVPREGASLQASQGPQQQTCEARKRMTVFEKNKY